MTTPELAQTLGLGIDDDLLKQIKIAARRSADRYLDLSVTWANQDPTQIAEFKGEISRRFPDIFVEPTLNREVRKKRLKRILEYTSKHFNMRRHQEVSNTPSAKRARTPALPTRRSNRTIPHKRRAKTVVPESPTPCFTATPSHAERDQSIAFVPTNQQRLPTMNALEPSTTPGLLSAFQGNPPGNLNSNADFSIVPGFALRGRLLPEFERPKSTPPHSQSSSLTIVCSSSSTPPSIHHSPQTGPLGRPPPTLSAYIVDEVAAFLGSCKPDMQFLLGSFITFGCRSNDFLRIVGGWPDAEIDDFLKRVVSVNPDVSKVVPEMELLLLRRHFKEYFSS